MAVADLGVRAFVVLVAVVGVVVGSLTLDTAPSRLGAAVVGFDPCRGCGAAAARSGPEQGRLGP